MISEERLRVNPAEEVVLDGGVPLIVPRRRPMYPLPVKGKYGRSDGLVLDVNFKSMKIASGGSGSIAANGGIFYLMLLCAGMVFLGGWLIFNEYQRVGSVSAIIVFICIVIFSMFGGAGIGFLRHLRREPVAYLLLIDRKKGKLVQMQGKHRVEAQWNDLRPYIEPVTSVSTVGASTSCNLHMVQPSEDGKRAWKHMMVQNALGLYDCLSTYEFLARYMEGDWEGLPDIHLLPGERPGFWDAYRYGFFNPWIGLPHWEDRSPRSRRWMWVFTPLWTILFWPFAMMPIIGSRFGYIPKFSAQDLTQAEYDPARDGPMPAALQNKIKPPQPLASGEKLLYWVSMGSGAILWLGFALKMLLLILD
ncbi:hypothetical protein [Stenotrophomonas sp. Iso1]|uniref:hypothetical protein n=1 Tax=Stenotrophomonas sp. Iso1 TaxID=2977283 RepID=UPI0022B7B367|nr:hypothetical protein [Stenotrophomonas sp. Iso1]